jgi:hypothetical protein
MASVSHKLFQVQTQIKIIDWINIFTFIYETRSKTKTFLLLPIFLLVLCLSHCVRRTNMSISREHCWYIRTKRCENRSIFIVSRKSIYHYWGSYKSLGEHQRWSLCVVLTFFVSFGSFLSMNTDWCCRRCSYDMTHNRSAPTALK